MFRLITSLLTIFIVLSLSACARLNIDDYEYVKPESSAGQFCATRCQQAFKACVNICGLKNPRCANEMRENAHAAFAAYEKKQRAKGWRVRRSYNDFLRSASCEKPCNCAPAYNTCYRACGGTVY